MQIAHPDGQSGTYLSMTSGSSILRPLPHSITPSSTLFDPDWTTAQDNKRRGKNIQVKIRGRWTKKKKVKAEYMQTDENEEEIEENRRVKGRKIDQEIGGKDKEEEETRERKEKQIGKKDEGETRKTKKNKDC